MNNRKVVLIVIIENIFHKRIEHYFIVRNKVYRLVHSGDSHSLSEYLDGYKSDNITPLKTNEIRNKILSDIYSIVYTQVQEALPLFMYDILIKEFNYKESILNEYKILKENLRKQLDEPYNKIK